MKRIVNVICVLALVFVVGRSQGWIDFVTPVSGEHEIVTAYRESLAADFAEIANGIDESKIAALDETIANAFDRAADASDRAISDDIDAIADDDFEGLKDLFRKLSEELQ